MVRLRTTGAPRYRRSPPERRRATQTAVRLVEQPRPAPRRARRVRARVAGADRAAPAVLVRREQTTTADVECWRSAAQGADVRPPGWGRRAQSPPPGPGIRAAHVTAAARQR